MAEGGDQGRTMFNIVWNCLSTTFICAWVSVHPNIPPPAYEEYAWKSHMRRIWLMTWTLLAPELVVLWSFRQWVAAGKIARIYNDRRKASEKEKVSNSSSTFRNFFRDLFRGRLDKEEAESLVWTRVHGHFVSMGGVILLQPEEPTEPPDTSESTESTTTPTEAKFTETIVDIHLFKALVKDPEFQIDITAEELNDKSKGDFISKSIALIQISWFIVQCIARHLEGLAITELEIVTLALGSMSGLMYIFWFDKPLNANIPIKITSQHRVHVEDGISDFDPDSTPGTLSREWASGLKDLVPNDGYTAFGFIVLSPILIPIVALFVFILLIATVADVSSTNTIPPGATHVPSFYSPKTIFGERFFLLILPIFGSLFGSIHCLAWNFTYPTRAERIIWHVASLTITLTPPALIFIPVFVVVMGECGNALWKRLWRVVVFVVFGLMAALAGFYVLARFVLFIEAFVLLRSQPADVFRDIDWTKFFPHF